MRVYELNFRGSRLIGVKHERGIVIPIAPVCEAMTIEVEPQRRRIRRDPILNKGGVIITLPFTGGGPQHMLCLPLNRLHYWLAGIESGRIKDDEMRSRVIEFQEECADALFVYFMPDYAAAVGVKLPTLEARVLHQDLFDLADAAHKEADVMQQIARMVPSWEEFGRKLIDAATDAAREGAREGAKDGVADNVPTPRAEFTVVVHRQIIAEYLRQHPDGIDPTGTIRIIADGNLMTNIAELHHMNGPYRDTFRDGYPVTKELHQKLTADRGQQGPEWRRIRTAHQNFLDVFDARQGKLFE